MKDFLSNLEKTAFRPSKSAFSRYLLIVLLIICDYCGVIKFFKQLSYDQEFSYPYEGDVQKMASYMKAGKQPPVPPEFSHSYYIKKNPNHKCLSEDGSHYEQLRLVYLVKSAIGNRGRRDAIRKSWGYEKRFSDVPIRRR